MGNNRMYAIWIGLKFFLNFDLIRILFEFRSKVYSFFFLFFLFWGLITLNTILASYSPMQLAGN